MTDVVTLAADGAPSAPALTPRPWNTSVPEDQAAGLAWVRNHQDGWSNGHQFAFAVLEEASGPEPRLVGHVVLREVTPGEPAAEVGYWTVADARGRGVEHRALEAVTTWAFDTFGPSSLRHLKLLHQVDNTASCRVAEKAGYTLREVLAPWPPIYPLEGHLHVRSPARQSGMSRPAARGVTPGRSTPPGSRRRTGPAWPARRR